MESNVRGQIQIGTPTREHNTYRQLEHNFFFMDYQQLRKYWSTINDSGDKRVNNSPNPKIENKSVLKVDKRKNHSLEKYQLNDKSF